MPSYVDIGSLKDSIGQGKITITGLNIQQRNQIDLSFKLSNFENLGFLIYPPTASEQLLGTTIKFYSGLGTHNNYLSPRVNYNYEFDVSSTSSINLNYDYILPVIQTYEAETDNNFCVVLFNKNPTSFISFLSKIQSGWKCYYLGGVRGEYFMGIPTPLVFSSVGQIKSLLMYLTFQNGYNKIYTPPRPVYVYPKNITSTKYFTIEKYQNIAVPYIPILNPVQIVPIGLISEPTITSKNLVITQGYSLISGT